MCKKFITMLILATSSTALLAATCPSVNDIKTQSLSGWKAYDSEDKTPLSKQRLLAFTNNAERFALAEWANTNKQSGTIHCYYQDKDGSDLEAYLEKKNVTHPAASSTWYTVTGALNCAASMDQCNFQYGGHRQEQQLARS